MANIYPVAQDSDMPQAFEEGIEDPELHFILSDYKPLGFWDTIAAAERLVHAPMGVDFAEPLRQFKIIIQEINASVCLFYQCPLSKKKKAYGVLYTLLENCRDQGEELQNAFAATELHFHEVSNAAQELIFAYGEHCLNGSAYAVVAQKKVLDLQREDFDVNKRFLFHFLETNVFPFLETVSHVIDDPTGNSFITLGFILQFVTEGLQVVNRLDICNGGMSKALFRTVQAMEYSISKFREGHGAHLDTSDSETEPEDALDIPIVRKKKAKLL